MGCIGGAKVAKVNNATGRIGIFQICFVLVRRNKKKKIKVQTIWYTSLNIQQTNPTCSVNIKTPIDRIRTIIRIRPLITDAQTNTLNW